MEGGTSFKTNFLLLSIFCVFCVKSQWIFPDDERLSTSSPRPRPSTQILPDRSNQGVIDTLISNTRQTQTDILNSLLSGQSAENQEVNE